MRKIIYWSRPIEGDLDKERAQSIFDLLRACAARTDISVEDWSHMTGDAEFFDGLDRMQFDDIRGGVIVVMDRSRLLEDFMFGPISLYKVKAIEVPGAEELEQDRMKRGAATALVLRYPGVWPIFINAGDADTAYNFNEDVRKKFDGLKAVLPGGDQQHPPMEPAALQAFVNFAANQHFVTESELRAGAATKSLPAVFHAPALGAQPLFDPTGLRTLVVAQLLYDMLLLPQAGKPESDPVQREATKRAISVLMERLRHPAVIVEEEEDFAHLAAYSAFRHGRRAWTVTNFKFFRDGVWRRDIAWAEAPAAGSGLVLRDYDVRFVDLQAAEQKVELRNIADWRCGAQGDSPIDTWIEHAWWRTCSSYSGVLSPVDIHKDEKKLAGLQAHWRLGILLPKARSKREAADFLKAHAIAGDGARYIGVRKPVSNALFFTSDLEDALLPTQKPLPKNRRGIAKFAYRSLVARLVLEEIASGSGSRHSPPPVNLEIASSLLDRVRVLRANGHPAASVHAAVMALEAYELLVGKSPSTSMEALHQMYLAETQLETTGLAISSDIALRPKRQDIAFSLNNVLGGDFKRERDYASKIWSGVRTIFRAADMFQAASQANINVLTSQKWFGVRDTLWNAWSRATAPAQTLAKGLRGKKRRAAPRRIGDPVIDEPAWQRGEVRLHVPGRLPLTESMKRLFAGIATDPGQWARAFIWFWIGATVVKIVIDVFASFVAKGVAPTLSDIARLLREPGHLLIASLTSQFPIALSGEMELVFQLFQIVFLSVNTLFMAFLVAMIVRQVTRD